MKSLDGVLAAQAESSGVGDAALHWWAAVQVVSWSVKSVTVSLEIPSGLAGGMYNCVCLPLLFFTVLLAIPDSCLLSLCMSAERREVNT